MSAVPNLCAVTVTCEKVEPVNALFKCADIDENNQVKRTFTSTDYTNGLTPGTYVTTYKVCVTEALTVCEEITVSHTLLDPCDPPNSVTLGEMTD